MTRSGRVTRAADAAAGRLLYSLVFMAIDDAVPPTPPADDKDWTWVLGAACPECGFQAGSVAGSEVAGLLRETAASWQVALAGVDVQHRPAPAVWSVLEYGTHCRDVYLIFGDRLRLLLEQDDPEFANWDQDATALEKRYWAGDPAVVAAELGAAAESAAQAFDGVAGQQWSRTGRRSNGSVFTVVSLGRYLVHDLVHHLHDIGRPLGGPLLG